MGTLFDPGIFSVVGLSGDILPGAKLHWYEAGTSTPLNTYADEDLTVPNTNPVLAAADGRFPSIWLEPEAYKLVLTDEDDVVLHTQDDFENVAGQLSTINGAGFVGYKAPGASTVATTVKDKLNARLDMEDLGAIGNGVADDGATINAAIYARYGGLATSQSTTYVEIHGRPGATYKFATPVSIRQNRIRFIGNGATIVCSGAYAFDFTQDGSTGINEAGAVIGWKITGATGAAVRTRGSAFTEIRDNWIFQCVGGFDIGAIGAVVTHNYIRECTGIAIALRATAVTGGGIVESQRCVVDKNRIYLNGYGIQLLQGGGHYIGANDTEVNGPVEVLVRCSFGNFMVGHYAEPTAGGTIVLVDNVTTGLPSIPGRTSSANQILGGTFGGGALYDIQINGGDNTYASGVRIGTGNVSIASGVSNTYLDRFALPPTVTDLGTDTVDINQRYDGQGIKLKALQGVYVGGVKVVSAQQSPIATVTPGSAPNDAINAIIVALRGFGLIAS